MMKLKNLVVNTDSAAKEIMQNWQYDDNSLSFWRGSSNFVYTFTHDSKRKWLRFIFDEEKELEQIRAEIDFLKHLYENNCNVPTLVKSKNNNYIEVVKTEVGVCYASVFNQAKGVSLEIGEVSEKQFELWGKTLAALHNLSSSYVPDTFVRKSWKDMLKHAHKILSDFPEEKAAIKELMHVDKWLSSLMITIDNYGLIHYDFELDNIFWDESANSFSAIDFDDCVYHWYVMDIVFALRDLQELEKEKSDKSFASFLMGYRLVRNIDEELIELLPKFERYSNIITFAKLLRSLKDCDTCEQPEWLIRLKPRLIEKCNRIRTSFGHSWE